MSLELLDKGKWYEQFDLGAGHTYIIKSKSKGWFKVYSDKFRGTIEVLARNGVPMWKGYLYQFPISYETRKKWFIRRTNDSKELDTFYIIGGNFE